MMRMDGLCATGRKASNWRSASLWNPGVDGDAIVSLESY